MKRLHGPVPRRNYTGLLASLVAIVIGLLLGFLVLALCNPPQATNGIKTLMLGGFTGGMNISQNHLVNLKRRSRVQDVHFRCLGPIAQQLETAFLMDWSFATGEHANFTVHPVKKQGSSLCRIPKYKRVRMAEEEALFGFLIQ